ncbi:MAG TPA: hypothetical protein VFE46_01755 [Pirellulales bacterium]|jgi:hypothetical protein|nr:hypothetical protein [Pirellulales bacterium]
MRKRKEIDVDEVLARRRQVAIIWSVEDVLEIRPDLNKEQAWEVLQRCQHQHDCEMGFTWTFIECIADDLFPADATREEDDDESENE